MKKEIYDTKEKLYHESVLLRQEGGRIQDYNEAMKVREKQDEAYKRYNFYKNIIKANDKINKNN